MAHTGQSHDRVSRGHRNTIQDDHLRGPSFSTYPFSQFVWALTLSIVP